MQTLPIVEHFDPFEDHASCFIARSEVTMPNQLILQAAEETLSHRIIIAVALAAHTRDHAVSRENINTLIPWFVKLAGFFLLFRPSSGVTHLTDLQQQDQDRFVTGFTFGAGRMFNAHTTLIAYDYINRHARIDPNDLYDALQLLSLRHSNRLFVTNERSFFRYEEDPGIHRVVPWEAFRES